MNPFNYELRPKTGRELQELIDLLKPTHFGTEVNYPRGIFVLRVNHLPNEHLYADILSVRPDRPA